MDERWQRMRKLFDSAIELDLGERSRWVRRACGDDSEMLRDIETLLDAHGSASAQFETPVFRLTDESQGTNEDPTRFIGVNLGPYRITRLIASGGMGHVFAARRADNQYDKTVAIKLIRQDVMGAGMVRRFQRERQALATFDHPNVARLLDAGVGADGCPFVVMEFVEGRTITEYCRMKNLDVEARLRLFLQVCDAVQCAHENLIIHCDLKPGNILVTDEGTCKLLDFSIAKLVKQKTSQSIGVTTAGRHMTPEYASPEQILGEPVNTRTDVYMLGVVLYELLTDLHPFRTGHRPLYELERVICEDDPDKPSAAVVRASHGYDSAAVQAAVQRRRRLAGDLDGIVWKAMRRSPDDRYRSVEQLADDVGRHLHGLPIKARPQTATYRLHRFVKRNRSATMATAMAIIAMFGGTIGMSLLYRAAATQRTGAIAARELAEKQAKLADAEARRSGAVVEFLQSMMSAANPSNNGSDVRVVDVLKAATASTATEWGSDPALESAVHSAIGKTYAGLGLYVDAKTHLLRSLAIESQLASQITEDEHTRQRQGARIARAHRELGSLYYDAGEFDEALRHAREALGISRMCSGSESPETAQDLNNLATILRARGDLGGAQTLLEEAAGIRERICGPESVELAESLNNLSNVIRLRGDVVNAEAYSRRVLSIRRARLPEDHPAIAQSLDNLGVVLAQRGQFDEAIELVRQASSIYRRVHPDGHPDLATNLFNLGSLLCLRGRDSEALTCFNDALSQRLRFFDSSSGPVMTTQMVRGECLIRLGRYDEAESTLLSIEEHGTQIQLANPALLRRIRDDLVVLYDNLNKPEQAASWRRLNAQSQ